MADLVIGGRRPSAKRAVRGVLLGVALIFFAIMVGYFIYRRAVTYTEPSVSVAGGAATLNTDLQPPRLALGNHSLETDGNLRILRLSGKPAELGNGRGRLLGPDATAAMTALAAPTANAVPDRGGIFSMLSSPRRRWALRFLEDGIPGHQLVELAGLRHGLLAGGAGAPSFETIVHAEVAPDLGVPLPASSGADGREVFRTLTVVAATRGGAGDRLLVGRLVSLPGLSASTLSPRGETFFPVLEFVRPDGVIPYASVGVAGTAGVMSGLNAEGIAVMVHPTRVRSVRASAGTQPIGLVARDVLENARTLDDAIAIIEASLPLGAAAYVVVDGNTRTHAVVEKTPLATVVDRSPTRTAIGDVLVGDAFQDDPENERGRRARPIDARTERARNLLRVPGESPDAVAALLRDDRGAGNAPLPPGHRGAIGDVDAQTVAIFDASGRVVWVATGTGPTAALRAFDLRFELGGGGQRPAPPPSIAAATSSDSASSARLARDDLDRARAKLLDGQPSRAAEYAARALERSPTLPEALEFDAQLARRRGNLEYAREQAKRYLESGPDSPLAAEELGALIGP